MTVTFDFVEDGQIGGDHYYSGSLAYDAGTKTVTIQLRLKPPETAATGRPPASGAETIKEHARSESNILANMEKMSALLQGKIPEMLHIIPKKNLLNVEEVLQTYSLSKHLSGTKMTAENMEALLGGMLSDVDGVSNINSGPKMIEK